MPNSAGTSPSISEGKPNLVNSSHDENQARAVEKILGGEDADMVDMTMAQLRSQKDRHAELIARMAQTGSPKARSRAQSILRFWEDLKIRRNSLAGGATDFASWEDLERFCWQLAEIESPGMDLEKLKAYMDELGVQVEMNLPKKSISPSDSIGALREVLARREGFRANLQDYFDPSNSYLHRVLEGRLGIPLTLALVYIFAGQRAGLDVYGINTPGHYLAGIGGVIFDPFHGAGVMSADDLAAKFGTDRLSWANPMHMRATPRNTAERMLINLLNSYSRRGDEARHSRIVSYLQMIEESFV